MPHRSTASNAVSIGGVSIDGVSSAVDLPKHAA